MNVLFILVVATACSMFLAATTGSTVLLYIFALSFLALCGYVYLLAQLRQRDQVGSECARAPCAAVPAAVHGSGARPAVRPVRLPLTGDTIPGTLGL